MTSPTETAGDHQIASERDRSVPEEPAFGLGGSVPAEAVPAETEADHQMASGGDRSVPEESAFGLGGSVPAEAVPAETEADHQMASGGDRSVPEESAFGLGGSVPAEAVPAETEADHQMASEDDPDMADRLKLASDGVLVAVEPQSSGPAVWEHPSANGADGAGDLGLAGGSGAPEPSAISEPGVDPALVDAASVDADNTDAGERWHEILAMFVDDPRSSVELAAGLIDDSAAALVLSVKERQHALLSAWQGNGAGTEELRVALQQYRTFWNRLEEFR